MIINERDSRKEQVLSIAKQIMTAARTAPKGKGMDIIEIVTVVDDELQVLANKLVELSPVYNLKFFLRDAENVRQSDAVILIGSRTHAHSLNCGYCGYPTCAEKLKHELAPCHLNAVDIGIAIGSACATAADLRVDSRVMFSAGFAAQKLNWLGDCLAVYALPISISAKSPFFDRKPKEEKQ